MIITQKFNSAFDIDSEFIPVLDELLSSCVPKFELIQSYEKNAPENIHFAYYLFFGNKTNAPIGFAQLHIENKLESKPSFLNRFFKKKTVEESDSTIEWKIPGSLGEGIIFDPMYIKHATEKTESIFNEYLARKDVKIQNIVFSEAYLGFNKFRESMPNSTNHLISVGHFRKKVNSYQSYLESLGSDQHQSIKNEWKSIQKILQYQMGEFPNFKEIFQYKSEGRIQYKELKDLFPIKKYINSTIETTYLTLESKERVHLIIAFTNGVGHNAFYEVLYIDNTIPENIIHQLAFIKFFEMPDLDKLHILLNTFNYNHLISLGFTDVKQTKVSITKKINA